MKIKLKNTPENPWPLSTEIYQLDYKEYALLLDENNKETYSFPIGNVIHNSKARIISIEPRFNIPKHITWKFMSTFSLGYPDQNGNVRYFGNKFTITFGCSEEVVIIKPILNDSTEIDPPKRIETPNATT